MLIRPTTTFAYPVLSPHTEDYGDRSFDITLEVEESPDVGQVKLTGELILDDPSPRDLLASGEATLGVVVECLETYFQRFIPVPESGFTLEFGTGELRGRVAMQAVIIASGDDVELESQFIASDYPPHTRRISTGDVIAASAIHTFEAGLDKLLPMESIFLLVSSEGVANGIFEVGLDTEAIRIEVHPELYSTIYSIRGRSLRDILLPSLFLPAVMNALDAMRSGDYEAFRWHRVIAARCNNEGISLDANTDLALAAQRLLDAPLGSLRSVFKESDE
jgi:hypothetical protein